MKKFFAIALTLMLAFSLIACAGNGNSATEEVGFGVQTDTQYTNEALGFSFTLPDGWSFATNEQIAQALQLGSEIIMDDPEAFKDALQDQPYFFDVMAYDSTGANNFNINYMDLAKTGLGALISAELYISMVESQFKEMSEAYQDAVYTQASHVLGNDTFATLSIDSTQTAMGLYQRQYLKKLGTEYLVVITITGVSMEAVDEIGALFLAQ